MYEISKERVELVDDILKGTLSVDEVQKRLAILEEKYGDDLYRAYTFEKKEKPWNRKYLEELENRSMYGAFSKDFVLHMAEVSESVHKKEKFWQWVRRIFIVIVGSGFAYGLIRFIIWFIKH